MAAVLTAAEQDQLRALVSAKNKEGTETTTLDWGAFVEKILAAISFLITLLGGIPQPAPVPPPVVPLTKKP